MPDLSDDGISEDSDPLDDDREDLALGVTIIDKVEDFESEPVNVPNADELDSNAGSVPKIIKELGDKHIDKVKEKKR